jgi:hypothetical protein
MNPVEDLEQALTLDQAEQFVDFDSSPATPEFCADFDE